MCLTAPYRLWISKSDSIYRMHSHGIPSLMHAEIWWFFPLSAAEMISWIQEHDYTRLIEALICKIYRYGMLKFIQIQWRPRPYNSCWVSLMFLIHRDRDKLPPFCRRHFQMQFPVWRWLYLALNFIKLFPDDPVSQKTALIQIITRQRGEKLSFESLVDKIICVILPQRAKHVALYTPWYYVKHAN